MQDITVAMAAALRPRTAVDLNPPARQPAVLYEVYPFDHYPATGLGFNPVDAIALWSEVGIDWNGNHFRRQVLPSRGDIQRFITSEFNRVEFSLANNDLYMSQFVINNRVEGLRLVIRYVDRTVAANLANSLVLFTGRLERPTSLNEEECRLEAKQDLGSINYEIPRRVFSSADPKGRSPNDPLYEGFKFTAITGTFQYTTTVTKRFLFFFTKKKKQVVTQQWSAENNTHEGEVIPNVYGRVQLELIPVLWADVGPAVKGIFVAAGHKITSITDIRNQSQGLTGPFWDNGASAPVLGTNLHLGDLGGTGTNANPTDQFPEAGYLSRTAYTSLYVIGSAPDVVDPAPTITAIVMGEAKVPDSIGNFTANEFTDNPSYLTRFILTSQDGIGLDERLIDDAECIKTARLCDEILLDRTNGELAVLSPDDAAALAADRFRRYRSSGVANSLYWKWVRNPDLFDSPFDSPLDDPFIFDFDAPPALIAPVTYYRRRYTFNAPLTDKTSATEFLFKTVFPAARLYMLIGPDGRLKIRTERPADSSFIRENSIAGATEVAINDVDPWLGLTPFVNQVYLATLLTSPTAPQLTAALALIYPATGLSIPGAASFVRGIFEGGTYAARGRTDAEFVSDLYLGYLGRSQDADGAAFWLNEVIVNGRSAALNGFDVSGEFRTRVETAGRAIQGYALLGISLTSSEVRQVTGSRYSTAGNSIPLVASASGTMTLTRSAATMAGGTDYVPPSGSFTVGGSPGVGAQLVATIDGVVCAYTLDANDDLGTAAAMLATAINATWTLKPYIRAVWRAEDPNVVRVYSKLGWITFSTPLVNPHNALLASPTVAPIGVAAAAGTLAAGDYIFAYSYTTATGETFISPTTTVTLTANQKINVSTVSLPAGASGLKWYLSKAHDDPTIVYLVSNTGAAFSINALPASDASLPPLSNSAGEETIRVMFSFTKENIMTGKFKWPLADEGSLINQILIKYREASAGFAERELYINDYQHQAQVQKINKEEIDGSGVDNFNQAWRLANSRLSKEREGDFFVEWDTDEAGIIFEEGDVICCTDRSGDFVNLPIRIEKVRIHADLSVTFTGRLYSTIMYSDETGQHTITLPSTLKYVNSPPPDAFNVVLTEGHLVAAGNMWVSTIHGEFDFGEFAGGQLAHIYVKYEGESEYRLIDNVLPDPNGHGAFEIVGPPRTTGAGHLVKIVTESQFGYSNGLAAATAYPIQILGPPALAQPIDLETFFDAGGDGDALHVWTKGADQVDSASQEVYDFEVRDTTDTTTVRGPIRVSPAENVDSQEYIIWGPDGGMTLLGEGGLDFGIGQPIGGAMGISLSAAEVIGGLLAEFEAPSVANPAWQSMCTYVSIYPESSYGYSGDFAFMWQFVDRSGPPEYNHVQAWWAYPEGYAGGDHDAFRRPVIAGQRYGIYIRPDGVAEYHINYSPSSTPVFISGRPVVQSELYRAFASSVGGPGGIRRARWKRQGPEWKHILAAQLIDYPLEDPPAQLVWRVRQKSPFSNGTDSPWATATFVRP